MQKHICAQPTIMQGSIFSVVRKEYRINYRIFKGTTPSEWSWEYVRKGSRGCSIPWGIWLAEVDRRTSRIGFGQTLKARKIHCVLHREVIQFENSKLHPWLQTKLQFRINHHNQLSLSPSELKTFFYHCQKQASRDPRINQAIKGVKNDSGKPFLSVGLMYVSIN